MPIRNVYELPFTRSRVRGGEGECLSATAFTADEFQSKLLGVGMTIVPPGASIGPHPHDDLEEIYIIVAGCGVATLDGREQRVGAGDVMVNPRNGVHGLRNDGDEDLLLYAFSVAL